MTNIINSFDNKLVKSIKKILTDKKYRDATNLFIGETKKVIDQLINSNIEVRNIICSDNSKYLDIYKKYNDKLIIIKSNVFDKLSSLANSDGVLGIFIKKKNDFEYEEGTYIILDSIQNPGNIGTIIRTACAFNVKGVVISNNSVDIFNPIVLRTTMGTIYNTKIKFVTNLSDIVKEFLNKNYKVYGTAIDDKCTNINDFKKTSSSNVIIFGNEGSGINAKILKMCNESLYIPINNIDSLNVAVSVGIILNKFSQ